MPKINTLGGQIKKIVLPTYPEDDPAWVTVQTGGLTTRDVIHVSDDDTEVQASIAAVTERIKEWNLEGEDGAVLPITIENVGKLQIEDFAVLAEAVREEKEALTDAEKKALSNISSASETVSPGGQTINVEVA